MVMYLFLCPECSCYSFPVFAGKRVELGVQCVSINDPKQDLSGIVLSKNRAVITALLVTPVTTVNL